MHIGKSAGCSLCSCCMTELNLRIFPCCFQYISLMSKAVCKDDLTSLICKVCCRIIASFIFTDESFLNNLRIVKTKLLFHLINSFHMSCCVTFILITDIDHSYFQVLFCNPFTFIFCKYRCTHGNRHYCCKSNCQCFLHSSFLHSFYLFSDSCYGTKEAQLSVLCLLASIFTITVYV